MRSQIRAMRLESRDIEFQTVSHHLETGQGQLKDKVLVSNILSYVFRFFIFLIILKLAEFVYVLP